MANPKKPCEQRGRAPESVLPFEPRIVVATLKDRPEGCLCPWVPRPDGFGLPYPPYPIRSDARQPWLTAGFALKYRDNSCPARPVHG